MKKIIIGSIVLLGLMFGGCVKSETGIPVSDTLRDAIVIYHDATHIVYEFEAEVERVNSEGFGKEK